MVKGYKGKHTQFNGKADSDSEKTDKELLDYIYGGYKKDVAEKEAQEVEELKQVANADMLKAYAFVRRQIVKLRNTWQKVTGVARKRVVWLPTLGALVAIVTLLALPIGDSRTGGPNDTLGTSDQPAFAEVLVSDSADFEGGSATISDTQGAIFKDLLDGASIRVIQQPYPKDISKDNGGLNRLALSVPEKLQINNYETDKGRIYVVSRERGQQTVIFAHGELLVFITADKEVSSPAWTNYVNRLH